MTTRLQPISLDPVAIAHTPFKEKFAIPRQPQLAPAAIAEIELLPPYNSPQALAGLEQSSHIWLIFQFHQALPKQGEAPRLRVRPPRLGGNEKIGVFASRATHRPNSLGQSVVKLEKIDDQRLWVSGVDLLDGTPILDIKPYVPYADSLPEAENSWAAKPPALIEVVWSEQASSQLATLEQNSPQPSLQLKALIDQCLAQDPKPAYQRPAPERHYGVRLALHPGEIEVSWHYPEPNRICVLALAAVSE